MSRPSRSVRRVPAAVLILIALVLMFFEFTGGLPGSTPPAAPPSGASSIHFLDVGQGDSALLLADGQAVLIDGGPTSAAEDVVDYLSAQGVTALEAVIATHPHEDHIGGLAAVLEAFPTETLYLPDKTANTRCFERMLDAAEAGNTALVTPDVGDVLSLANGITLTFLSPPAGESYENTNNYSLVTRIDAGETRVLMMGDAEAEIEEVLLADPDALACDVLKVGHHGSNTSSTKAFLAAADPARAVISCGVDNEYGHPHAEVLERLNALGTTLHITAQDGACVLSLP